MLTSIKDRSVIVTGGSKGIARVFAAKGAKVMIAARGEEDAKRAVDEITADGGTAAYTLTDVCDWAEVQALVAATETAYGGVDILCSNAGIFPQAKIDDLSPEDWDHVLDTNLKSTFLCVKAVLPAMEKANKGRIVITSSITGPRREKGRPEDRPSFFIQLGRKPVSDETRSATALPKSTRWASH